MTDREIRYDYRDATGRLRYTVVRLGHGPGKSFAIFDPEGQVLPDPIPAGQRLLFRLPDLLAASPGETVYLAEGEKDAETLAAHGLVATTMPCGTRGGWLASYTSPLEGRHVVILPDNDGPGRRHGEAVRTELTGHAASVLLLELGGPSGLDDVTTWFDRQALPADKLRDFVRRERYHAAGLRSKHPPAKTDAIRLVLRSGLEPLQRLMLILLIESLYSGICQYRRIADLAEDCGVHRVSCQRAMQRLRLLGIMDGLPTDRGVVRWDLLAAIVTPPILEQRASVEERRAGVATHTDPQTGLLKSS